MQGKQDKAGFDNMSDSRYDSRVYAMDDDLESSSPKPEDVTVSVPAVRDEAGCVAHPLLPLLTY